MKCGVIKEYWIVHLNHRSDFRMNKSDGIWWKRNECEIRQNRIEIQRNEKYSRHDETN